MKNGHRRCTLLPSLKTVTFREHVARRRDVSRNTLLSPKSKEDQMKFLFYIHFWFHVATHMTQGGASLCFKETHLY